MLNDLKILLGISDTSKDSLLQLLLNRAEEDAIAITHNEAIADVIPTTILNMAIFQYNRMGSEGLQSESYSGVSYSYLNEYPPSIMASLKAHRKVVVL